MTSRQRILGWGGLVLLGLAAIFPLFVLPAMRADAREEIRARVRALHESGVPLSFAELIPPLKEGAPAARPLAEFPENDGLDPWSWELPADAPIEPDEFAELVGTRIFAGDLSADERALVATWVEEHREELEAIRKEPLGNLTASGMPPSMWPHLFGLCRILSVEAVLAAYDGDAAGLLAGITEALTLASLDDDRPLAVGFLRWVYGTSFPLAAGRRAMDLLSVDADLSPLLAALDSMDVEGRLRTALLGERVYYLESMGLVRNGEPAPEDQFVFRRRSPWQPLSWPPYAEWGVLDDLLVLDALIDGGIDSQGFPLPERTSGVVRAIVNLDIVSSANAHKTDLDRLRASLKR